MNVMTLFCLCLILALWGKSHPSIAQQTAPPSHAPLHPQPHVPLKSTPLTPAILLAHVYQQHLPVSDYLVSEKLDGIRAFWDGEQLITRQGHVIHAPAWFTRGFPKRALDGELWLGRGRFEQLSSIVRTSKPDSQAWQAVKYYIFELPNGEGDFSQRAKLIKNIVKQTNVPQLKAVPQFKVKDQAALKRLLNQIVARKGEGVMLHRMDAQYVTGRSQVLLKLKPQLDAEATVIGCVPGKGKYQGMMGALLVETPEGVQFKLGTGFSDAERRSPPALGSQVTYTYSDLTVKGKPKFARFLRVRPPETSSN